MTVEELLKPRYKVIADYPSSPFFINDILPNALKEWQRDNERTKATLNECEKYPAIFKKLEWWEEREIEDMPEYLKDDNGVYKCRNWHYQSRKSPDLIALEIYNFEPERSGSGWSEKYLLTIRYKNILPATKEEYDAYELKQLESLKE